MCIAEELLAFIEESPTAFHAAAAAGKRLTAQGYQQLSEHEKWHLEAGGRYYVMRNDSSVIAFRIPKECKIPQEGDAISGGPAPVGFQIIASHSDSPSFKIKEQPEISVEGHYVKLNVEKYGGMLCAPWLDRPLSAAGRVIVRTGQESGQVHLESRLIQLDRDLLLIPSLAIHMNREVNEGMAYNAQKDLLPLFACGEKNGSFDRLVEEAAGAAREDILASDLFLYSRSKGSIWGSQGEFISCGRLDDLQCAYASLKGFLESREEPACIPVYCLLDNEEVGSSTKQGAASTFLKDTLKRMNRGMGGDGETYLQSLAQSFMVSADNAHAVHPNYADKTDPTNRPYINEGIVIKHSANQKYTTDAVSEAVFKVVCQRAEVPVQSFFNRSDMAGGSTLGNIANNQTPMNTVDIGLPQLAMHSPYETAGVRDTEYLVRAAEEFYSCCVSEWFHAVV